MAGKDGQGPKGTGPRDGHGGGAGRGGRVPTKPSGPKSGGGKGTCPFFKPIF